LAPAADEYAAFEIGVHGAAGEIGATDPGDAVVNDEDLCVEGSSG
jgi:hypothetical protein